MAKNKYGEDQEFNDKVWCDLRNIVEDCCKGDRDFVQVERERREKEEKKEERRGREGVMMFLLLGNPNFFFFFLFASPTSHLSSSPELI
jgi:hypothetical protein